MRPEPRLVLLALVGLAACIGEDECRRRIDAAHRDALRDAPVCRFAPASLPEPECGGNDRRPVNTYYGVWCSTAELGCIDDRPEAFGICFGQPEEVD